MPSPPNVVEWSPAKRPAAPAKPRRPGRPSSPLGAAVDEDGRRWNERWKEGRLERDESTMLRRKTRRRRSDRRMWRAERKRSWMTMGRHARSPRLLRPTTMPIDPDCLFDFRVYSLVCCCLRFLFHRRLHTILVVAASCSFVPLRSLRAAPPTHPAAGLTRRTAGGW